MKRTALFPPFTLPAGDSVVGKIKVDVTIPKVVEGGKVILQFKDGLFSGERLFSYIFLDGKPHASGEDCQALGDCPDSGRDA